MSRAPRVASLIPSGTEIVAALGMADTLVGRSHCCDYPPEVVDLPVLSDPKVDPTRSGGEIDAEVRALLGGGESVYRILAAEMERLRPDVVVTQDHCDACAVSLRDVEAAVACGELAGARVCALHPHDLDAVCGDFRRVADALGVPGRGLRLVERFRARLAGVAARVAGRPRPGVLLLEWLDPPMVAGGWMPELADLAGARPLVVSEPDHFAQVGWREVREAAPDVVVVLPCGYGVQRTAAELDQVALRDPEAAEALGAAGACWVVDGDAYFNRPGPRLAESAELLAALVHPEAFPDARARYRGSWARWRVPEGAAGPAGGVRDR